MLPCCVFDIVAMEFAAVDDDVIAIVVVVVVVAVTLDIDVLKR